ncbi:hypothetical protein CSUB01_08844 [Colletotrichum sublineola]|uniref:BZIP domain-containing protein n=1 Tax=Colletotrichum sublineola TaxID=1173701 RepID=A0A066XCK9_COLSU|nr:hypothetical protein CSUB01_08844 [Colletotrichum sublineola]
MYGPYSSEFPFLDGHQAPYIFEDGFTQSVSPYSVDPYQYEQAPSASEPLYQPHNQETCHQAQQPLARPHLAHDGLPYAKRLRSSTHKQRQTTPWAECSTPPRSTTPDCEPPYHARIFCPESLLGGFSAVLSSSLSIPNSVSTGERLRRQHEIRHIFAATKSTTLPPPSPFAKGPNPSAVPDSPTDIYRIRVPPARISILPMQPKRSLGSFVPVANATAGAEREAAVAHNNQLAAARLADLKRRNNAAALRSRSRKERAVAGRTEELSRATAQMNWWKARAVSLGAAADEWDALPMQAVREALVAEYRVDAMDFSRDGPDELGITKTAAAKRKKRKTAVTTA